MSDTQKSPLEVAKDYWYSALKPLEELVKKEGENYNDLVGYCEGLPPRLRAASKQRLDELKKIVDENQSVVSGYRSKIESATEDMLVSDDLDLMYEEIKKSIEIANQNAEYLRQQEREFM